MKSKVAQYTRFKILGWLDPPGTSQTWTVPTLQTMAPVDYLAGSRELGCVPEVFLGYHTTVRACASRYDHFLYIENQPNDGRWHIKALNRHGYWLRLIAVKLHNPVIHWPVNERLGHNFQFFLLRVCFCLLKEWTVSTQQFFDVIFTLNWALCEWALYKSKTETQYMPYSSLRQRPIVVCKINYPDKWPQDWLAKHQHWIKTQWGLYHKSGLAKIPSRPCKNGQAVPKNPKVKLPKSQCC